MTRKVLIIGSKARSLVNFRGSFISELVRRGFQVVACAPDIGEAIARQLDEIGAGVEHVPMTRAGVSPFRDLATLKHVVRLCRRERPAIVFCYTVKPVIYGLLGARLAGVKARVPMITGLGHSFLSVTFKGRLIRLITSVLYRLALAGSRVVVFHNPDDLQEFRRRRLFVANQRTLVVAGSGVDTLRFSPVARANHGIHFLFVGRLIAEKGLREFIEAARIVRRDFPDARFSLVGNTDPNPTAIPRAEIESWVAEGIVVDMGWHEDVRPMLADCTALVLPSYREGTPRTALEAMSMGRAVITTDVPGCRETVVDGDNGFLVPARNAEILAERIGILAKDPTLADRMGQVGRGIATERFEASHVARQLADGIVS